MGGDGYVNYFDCGNHSIIYLYILHMCVYIYISEHHVHLKYIQFLSVIHKNSDTV